MRKQTIQYTSSLDALVAVANALHRGRSVFQFLRIPIRD